MRSRTASRSLGLAGMGGAATSGPGPGLSEALPLPPATPPGMPPATPPSAPPGPPPSSFPRASSDEDGSGAASGCGSGCSGKTLGGTRGVTEAFSALRRGARTARRVARRRAQRQDHHLDRVLARGPAAPERDPGDERQLCHQRGRQKGDHAPPPRRAPAHPCEVRDGSRRDRYSDNRRCRGGMGGHFHGTCITTRSDQYATKASSRPAYRAAAGIPSLPCGAGHRRSMFASSFQLRGSTLAR
jgi:hypothetical protein